MTHSLRIKATLVAGLLLPAIGRTQEAGDAPTAKSPDQVLKSAIDTMSTLASITFRSTETQDSAMSRRMQRQIGAMLGGGQEVEVRGDWAQGVLHANLNDDADEILAYRGRQIARNDDVTWKLRRGRFVTGAALPFVPDPSRLFEALAALPKPALAIRHHEASTFRDQPVMILSLTLEGAAAQEFALSGGLPEVQAGVAGLSILGAGLGAAAPTMPELTVDLALQVDPATGYVHRILSRSYQKSAMGNMRIQFGGAGGGEDDEKDAAEEAEEDVAELGKDGKRIYQRGLPVRKLAEDLSRVDFDIVFSKHGEAPTRKIDERARQLLRLPVPAEAPTQPQKK